MNKGPHNVRHAAQVVARHLADSDEAQTAAEAGDNGRKGPALSASAEPPSLLTRHLRRTRAEQVVYVGGRLTTPLHSSLTTTHTAYQPPSPLSRDEPPRRPQHALHPNGRQNEFLPRTEVLLTP